MHSLSALFLVPLLSSNSVFARRTISLVSFRRRLRREKSLFSFLSQLPMDSIDALIAHVQGLSSCPEDLNALHVHLNQAEELLLSQVNRLANSLDQLDPSKHSLGYLYLLEAYTSGPISREQAGEIVRCIARFIMTCVAEQIRLAPEKFVSVCKRLKDQVMLLQVPIQGIVPMRGAVRKLQSSPEHLTPVHPDFLLLCLLAKCYKAGLSVLEDDIIEVDQPKDFFLYCYYGNATLIGNMERNDRLYYSAQASKSEIKTVIFVSMKSIWGMINIGLKNFRKALEHLHNVVTAPMTSLNAIAIEAYKKYTLVSLIYNGQVPTFPKYTSSVAQRNLKSYTQAYIDLAASYATGKISELETCFEANVEKYKTDNNVGLVKQVLSSLSNRNIQRLTQTYLTLSLQDIANSAELENSKQAEMHVLEMIQDGEIFAAINQKDGMVRFHEDSEQYKSCEMIERIDTSIQRVMTLTRKLNAIDERISCDPAYLAKSGRERPRFDLDDFDSVPQKFL